MPRVRLPAWAVRSHPPFGWVPTGARRYRPAPTWPLALSPTQALDGDVGWYVPAGHTRCPRCADQNWTEHRLCITCTHGDPGYRNGEFRDGWSGR